MPLSSSLIAIGFVAGTELLVPFAAILLPPVFLLGIVGGVRMALLARYLSPWRIDEYDLRAGQAASR